jgi:hypothetical protein
MGATRRLPAVGLACVAALCFAAAPGGSSVEPKRNYAADWAAFNALSQERQRHLREIDRQLAEEDSDTRARLIKLMQQYVDWLDRLPPEQRRRVESAPTIADKIERIRDVLEEQWIAGLPKAERERLDRHGVLVRWAFLERSRRAEQERLGGAPMPAKKDPRAAYRDDFQKWKEELQQKKLLLQEKRALDKPRPPLKLMFELSEKYRVDIPPRMYPPVLPERRLFNYARVFFTEDELLKLEADLIDPEQRERARLELIVRYWRDHPNDLKAVLEADDQKKANPARGGGKVPPED